MRRTAVTLITAMLVVAAPAAARPSQLYVFGDSLVDAGNAFIGTGGNTAQPGYGYFFGRYSNGPVWTDLIEQRLSGNDTTPYLAGGDNYAVGGALAAADRPLQGFTVPGLVTQLGYSTVASGGIADPNGLYVLNFGNNDVSTLLAGLAAAPNPTAAAIFRAAYTAAFVGNYLGAVTTLNSQGATQFLIGGVPNPDIPEGVALQAALEAGLSTLVLTPGSTLVRFDYFDFFNRLRADPVAFGLPADIDLNLANACVDISVAPSNPNPDCRKFFSFDGIHPTAPIHAALAREIGQAIGIGAVPEPAVWAQMLVGFALAGAAIRRRRNLIAA